MNRDAPDAVRGEHPSAPYQEKMVAFYRQLDRDDEYEQTWGYGHPVAGPYFRNRDTAVLSSVQGHFPWPLHTLRVLEVGVGHGHELAKFAQLGVPQSNLTGIDLVSDRLDWGRAVYPAITFVQGDATRLDFPDASFDVVCQFGCLVHLPSREMQQAACREIARVLRPGGIIVWWDLAPIRWRVVVARRWHALTAARWRDKPRWFLYLVKQTLHETVAPSVRRASCVAGWPEGYHPIGPEELPALFPGLRVQAGWIGTDYECWKVAWGRNRAAANRSWDRARLSVHCFATIKK